MFRFWIVRDRSQSGLMMSNNALHESPETAGPGRHVIAVSSLEVRVLDQVAQDVERRLRTCAAMFECLPGCLGYSVIQSRVDAGLWIFSGYWCCELSMTAHFGNPLMTALVNHLIASRANLTFNSFLPAIDGEI